MYISKIFKFDYETAIPLIYQSGSRNLPVAMVVAISSFKNQAVLGVAACMLSQFPISALFYKIISRYSLPRHISRISDRNETSPK
jgi:ACR3 family arsenite efflux pump ArsB